MDHARFPAQPFGETDDRHDVAAQIGDSLDEAGNVGQRCRLVPLADFYQRAHVDAESLPAERESDDLAVEDRFSFGGAHAASPFGVKRLEGEATSASISRIRAIDPSPRMVAPPSPRIGCRF